MDRRGCFSSLLAEGEEGRARLASEVGNPEDAIELGDVLLRNVVGLTCFDGYKQGCAAKSPETARVGKRGKPGIFLEKGCRTFIFE